MNCVCRTGQGRAGHPVRNKVLNVPFEPSNGKWKGKILALLAAFKMQEKETFSELRNNKSANFDHNVAGWVFLTVCSGPL